MLAPQKESIFGCSCRLWLLSWRRARIFARSCSLLSKYLPISWKQRKEQSHAQCHVTHRIRIFDKISEHVKVAKSVDIAVPELAVTVCFKITYSVFGRKDSNFLYCASFTRVRVGIFPKFILKHRLYPEEILNLDGLLVTANWNP